MEDKLYIILQLCDSAFPTGGFAHSMGSEAAVGNSYIKSKDDIRSFVFGSLENLGSFSIPFVFGAYTDRSDKRKLQELSSLLDASLTNHVARRSSLQQGATLLTSSCEIFGLPEIEELQGFIENENILTHQAIIYGVVCSCLNLPIEKAVKMFMFGGLRTIIASLVRLGKIGAIEAQKFQYEFQESLDDIISRNKDVTPCDAALTFPALDVLQMSHDTFFSKLFIT